MLNVKTLHAGASSADVSFFVVDGYCACHSRILVSTRPHTTTACLCVSWPSKHVAATLPALFCLACFLSPGAVNGVRANAPIVTGREVLRVWSVAPLLSVCKVAGLEAMSHLHASPGLSGCPAACPGLVRGILHTMHSMRRPVYNFTLVHAARRTWCVRC